MSRLAQAWYDDPDGQFEQSVEHLMDCFRRGVISGSECSTGRATAERCRDEAKAENARRKS